MALLGRAGWEVADFSVQVKERMWLPEGTRQSWGQQPCVQQESLPHVEVGLCPDGSPCRGPECVSGVPKRTANTSQPCGGHLTDWGSQEPWGISAVTGLPQICDISLGH